jgi:hypothetical protein
MARSQQNIILKALHGAIGKEFVIKQYGKKTVVSKYPDMTQIQATTLQEEQRNIFKEAVAYVKKIINDPAIKAVYAKKVKRGQTVYNYALKEYLAKKSQNFEWSC